MLSTGGLLLRDFLFLQTSSKVGETVRNDCEFFIDGGGYGAFGQSLWRSTLAFMGSGEIRYLACSRRCWPYDGQAAY